MDLQKTLDRINSGRERTECCFVFSVWKEPSLYEDYKDVNIGKDNTLINEDAVFYWDLGRAMYQSGLKNFDAISIEDFLTNKKVAKKQYEEFGGYSTVKELKELTDPENIDAYYDKICKDNALISIATSYEKIFTEKLNEFDNFSSEDVYNTFDAINNKIAVNSATNSKVEDLVITQKFLDDNENGINIGLQYGKAAPILNYTTLGLPLGDITLLTGFSGSGKTSFVFENMVIPISENEKVTIFSNEMGITAYQNLLLSHILTKDLNYWELTRKKIKQGKYSDKDKEMLKKAIEISTTKYNIKFIKLFDNDTGVIMKYMKQLARQGCQCFVWDTFKGDDISDGSEAWLQLLMNSRKIFNLVSKLNVALVCTFQLALYTTNQRYLDASCLSSSKQIKEVVSELLMMRKLWSDEYTGEKCDCKAYRLDQDKKKQLLQLDSDKTYIIVFINKTRNDESDREILYEWNSRFNKWVELGYCIIRNDHKGG